MTIHRAYGHVDRTALRDGAPLRVVMCSEGKQADGIDLRMSGADLARFRANPVLGYGHAYFGRTNLPIGRVNPDSIAVDGPRALGDLDFDQADEFARIVERKMRDGFLNAVSIGFEVTKWQDDKGDYWRGGVAEQWEMHELSVVPVQMDVNSVVVGGRSGAPALYGDPELYEQTMRWLHDQVSRLGLLSPPHLGEALRPPGLTETGEPLRLVGEPGPELMGVTLCGRAERHERHGHLVPGGGVQLCPGVLPEPTPVQPAGVPTDAARDLLAALKP